MVLRLIKDLPRNLISLLAVFCVLLFLVVAGGRNNNNNGGEIKIERVLVKAGTLMTGVTDGYEGYYNETPISSTFTKDFNISKYEVTQKQCRAIMGTNPYIFHGDNLLVENMSWDEAVAFCKAVGERLPMEAESEFATRVGSWNGYSQSFRVAFAITFRRLIATNIRCPIATATGWACVLPSIQIDLVLFGRQRHFGFKKVKNRGNFYPDFGNRLKYGTAARKHRQRIYSVAGAAKGKCRATKEARREIRSAC